MQRIAVIGSGIAGMGAAWALDREHDVVVYEADGRLGGHAHTVDVEDDGRAVAVDTGFIVYNETNYPNLVRLFDALDVPTEPSDMSFSVSRANGGFEFRSRGAGVFAQPTNLARPGMWRMLRDFRRFCREAPGILASGSRESLGSYLARSGYSDDFRLDLLLPMTAAIWSTGLDDMLEFPVVTLVRFLTSHAMLQVGSRPRWRTVSGGSREYVSRLTAGFRDRARLSAPVVRVERGSSEVLVRDLQGRIDRFDHVVFATHADTTLSILGKDATPSERAVLSAFRFRFFTAGGWKDGMAGLVLSVLFAFYRLEIEAKTWEACGYAPAWDAEVRRQSSLPRLGLALAWHAVGRLLARRRGRKEGDGEA